MRTRRNRLLDPLLHWYFLIQARRRNVRAEGSAKGNRSQGDDILRVSESQEDRSWIVWTNSILVEWFWEQEARM